jgi:hypothetical protein
MQQANLLTRKKLAGVEKSRWSGDGHSPGNKGAGTGKTHYPVRCSSLFSSITEGKGVLVLVTHMTAEPPTTKTEEPATSIFEPNLASDDAVPAAVGDKEAALDEELQQLFGQVESSQQEMKELNEQMEEKHRLLTSLSSMQEEQKMMQMFNELEIMKQALIRDADNEEAREIMEQALSTDEKPINTFVTQADVEEVHENAEDVEREWEEMQIRLEQAKKDRDAMKLMKEQLEMEMDLFAKELER